MSTRAASIALLLALGVGVVLGRLSAPEAPPSSVLPVDTGDDAPPPPSDTDGPELHPASRPAGHRPPGAPAPGETEPAAPVPFNPGPVPVPASVQGAGEGALVHVDEGSYKVVKQGGTHQLVRHGEWVDAYPDGRMKLRAGYADGRLHGDYESFHPDGTRDVVTQYEQGAQHGEYKRWWPDGTLREERQFERGKPSGIHRTWHANGNLASVGPYGEQGQQHGTWTSYSEGGVRRLEEVFREGTSQGLAFFDEHGNPTDPKADTRRASMEGKYSELLKTVTAPEDKIHYGEFKEYGKYQAIDYKGVKGIPEGYWVWVYPTWYIWKTRNPPKAK